MKRHVVARAKDIGPGERKVVTIDRVDICIFNVGGNYYALRDRCPHEGASLSKGRISGLVESDAPNQYRVCRRGELIKCPWHGWEFDIRTGQSWCDPNTIKVRPYPVEIEDGDTLAKGPYVAESFEVAVEDEYLVMTM